MPCPNHPGAEFELISCWRCRQAFCANCTIELLEHPFCAECKIAQVRDLLAGTDLLSPDYATMDRRFGAWMIDGVVKFGISMVVGLTGQFLAGTMMTGNLDQKKALFALFANLGFAMLGYIIGACYEGWMLAVYNGQTLGKMAVRIRVVTPDGGTINAYQAWWRSAVKLFLFCVGMETCIGVLIDAIFAFGEDRTSLHDLAAKTRVINVP